MPAVQHSTIGLQGSSETVAGVELISVNSTVVFETIDSVEVEVVGNRVGEVVVSELV